MIAIGTLFGCKASAMERGGSHKRYIRAGETHALIRAEISNGSEYRPNTGYYSSSYGNILVIEKRVYAEGAAKIKIITKDGEVVGRTQEDIYLLMEHFRVNLKNPLCFLTQEKSKQLLKSATPSGMYSFFMQGTGIKQMEEIHSSNQSSVEHMKSAIKEAEAKEKSLEQALTTVINAIDLCHSAEEIEKRINQLNKELPSAEISQKEEKKRNKTVKREKLYAEYASKSERRKNILKEIAEAVEETRRIEEEQEKQREKERQREKEIDANMKKEKEREAEIKRDLNCFSFEMERQRQQIEQIEKILGINKDNQRENEVPTEEEKQQLQREIEEKEKSQTELEIKTAQSRICMEKKKEEIREVDTLIKRKRELLNTCAEINPMRFFGPAMERALAQIKAAEIQAVGPLGISLKVKEQKWSRAIEAALGHTVYGFIVHTQKDKDELEKIFRQLGITKYQIYLTRPHVHRRGDRILEKAWAVSEELQGKARSRIGRDLSQKEFCSVLFQLQDSDQVILEQLIIISSIERIGLASNRQIGYSVLRERVGFESVFTPEADRIQYIGQSLSDMRCSLREARLLNSKERAIEVGNEIDEQIRKRNQLLEEISRVNEEIKGFSSVLAQKRESDRVLRERMQRIRWIEQESRRKKELEKDDLSVEHSNLLERHKKDLLQYRSIEETYEEIKIRIEKLQQEKESICIQIRKTEREEQEREEILKRQLQQEELHMSSVREKIERADTEIEELERQIEEKKASTSTVIMTNRAPEEIEKEMVVLQAKIMAVTSQREEKDDLYRKKDEIQRDKDRINSIIETNREEIEEIERWTEKRISIRERMKREMAEYVSGKFTELMGKREYVGQIHFDHKKEILDLKVLTESKSKGNKNTLSGGERSYAGISFLLSMWPVLFSPLRVLDEFDVFMDSLNRKAALKLIVDLSRDIDSQIILITPQETYGLPEDICEIISLKPIQKQIQ